MLRTLGQFAVLYAVPALSWLAITLYSDEVSGAWVNGICRSTNDWRGECAVLAFLPSIEQLVFYAFIAATIPVVVFFAVGVLCGANRRMNAAVFPMLVPVALFFAAVNLLIQGTVLLMDLYALFAYATGFVRFLMVRLAAAVLIILVFLAMMRVFFTHIEAALPVRASVLPLRVARPLRARIAQICDALGLAPPDRVLVGLEPTIWATAGPVQIIGQGPAGRLEGTTLYLSLPMLRVLDEDQAGALIATEMAQFLPANRAYAAQMLPLYAALSGAYARRDQNRPLVVTPAELGGTFNFWKTFVGIISYPVRAMLGLLATCFSANVRRMGRRAVRQADRAARDATGAEPLGSALIRMSAYAPLWPELLRAHAERVRELGRVTPNLAAAFAHLARFGAHRSQPRALLRARVPHPICRPTINERRLRDISLPVRDAIDAGLAPPVTLAGPEDLVPGLGELEFETTLTENRWLYVTGRIPSSPGSRGEGAPAPFYLALYGLLVALINGGRLPKKRFARAAARAPHTFVEFDPLDLASAAAGQLAVPDVSEAARLLRQQTPESETAPLLALIRDVMAADGRPGEAENAMMQELEALFTADPAPPAAEPGGLARTASSV